MKRLTICLALASGIMFGQRSVLTVTEPPPTGAQNLTLTNIGTQQNRTYCYWVVAVYPIGMSPTQGPACTSLSSAALNSSNYNKIGWQIPPGATATGYWLVRGNSSTFPGSGTVAVNTSVLASSTVTLNDQSNTLHAFTYKAIPVANGIISINNQSQPTPVLNVNVNGTNVAAFNSGSQTVPGSLTVNGTVTTIDTDSGTTTIVDPLAVIHRTTGTPAAGFGSGIITGMQNTTGVNTPGMTLETYWQDPTSGNETVTLNGQLELYGGMLRFLYVDDYYSNASFGSYAMLSLTSGTGDTTFGVNAGEFITSGSGNALVGGSTGLNITTGASNTAMGANGCRNVVAGSGNICLGFSAGPTTDVSNKLFIDSNGGASNTPLIGGDFAAKYVTINGGLISGGTTFTVPSGCGTATSLTGGAQAGSFVVGATSCVPLITFGITAPHGWSCFAADITHPVNFTQTATSTTTCTVSATVTSSDVVVFHAMAY